MAWRLLCGVSEQELNLGHRQMLHIQACNVPRDRFPESVIWLLAVAVHAFKAVGNPSSI